MIDHEQEEHERDIAEGIRIAYVAATRARDLWVVAGVGDGPQEGWLEPLNKALYPQKANFRASTVASACPLLGNASVLLRPADYDGSPEFSVKPGLHTPENGSHKVVWWDPALLKLQIDASFGLRQEEILVDDDGGHASEGQDLYDKWKFVRNQSIDVGRVPTTTVLLATDDVEPPPSYPARVEVVTVPRNGGRPKGRRFGSLVHLIMRDVDLRAGVLTIERLAHAHARLPAEGTKGTADSAE